MSTQNTATSGRFVDTKLAMSILNSRAMLAAKHIGQQVVLSIQGKGTFVPKDEAKNQPFDKYIYNLKANSQYAMSLPANKALLTSAVKAESIGNVDEATKLFNQYLNSIQVSFNVIADRAYRFQDGDMVTAVVGEVTTKAGHKALTVDTVRYKAPAAVEKTKFDVTALMLDEEALTPTPEIVAGAAVA